MRERYGMKWNGGMKWNARTVWNEMKWNEMEYAQCLKPNTCADHTTYTGAARPATADLALDENIAVLITESHATSAAIALVVGVEGTGETCGGGARVRVGELESLHSERTNE